MKLAHDVVVAAAATTTAATTGTHTIVFLHGILGSRNNWKSFAQELVTERPTWRAVLCDLRNHGESHGAPPPHTLDACADDVTQTIDKADVVVGHSFGGKVALALAKRAWPQETWVLDCPPGPRTFGGADPSEIARVLEAIRGVHVPIASRAALVDALRGVGLSDPLAKWMTTNLRPAPAPAAEGFVWKFALDAIPEMLASFGAMDAWDVVEAEAAQRGRVVMVRAGRSDRWSADDVARLTRAAARGSVVEHVMQNAGHWLHTDDPATLLALLSTALASRNTA